MILNLPKLGLVRFDDNLSDEELKQQLGALSQKYDLGLDKSERGLGTLFGQSVVRGAKQLGSGLFDVLPAIGASALGFNEYAQKQIEEAKQTEKEIAEKYPAEIPSYTKIESPYQALQYGVETLGEVGSSAFGAGVPGILGRGLLRGLTAKSVTNALTERAAAKGLTGEAAEKFIERGTSMLAPKTTEAITAAGEKGLSKGLYLGSFVQNAPEVFQNVYEETGKFEPLVSVLAGGVMAVLDSVVPLRVMKGLGLYGKLKLTETVIKDSGAAPSVWKAIGKEATKAAAAEGLTESAQEAISVAAEQVAGGMKGFLDPQNIQRYKESFVKGAVGGAAFGVIGGAGRGLSEKADYQKQLSKILPSEEAKPSEKVSIPEMGAVPAVGEAVTEPPVQEGFTRVYHSGSVGEGSSGRFVSTDRRYAEDYRQDLPLFYLDIPSNDPRVNNPEYSDQGVAQGFTFNFELTPDEASALKKIERPQTAVPAGLGSVDELVAQKKTQYVFGLGHTAKIFREEPGAKLGEGGIKGLSFDNPEHLPQIRAVLDRTARSTKVEGAVTKLETLLDQLPKTEGAPDVTRPYQQPSGAGAEVLGGRDTGAAARAAGEAKPSGVDFTGGYADELAGGEGKKPSALKVPAPAPTAAETVQIPIGRGKATVETQRYWYHDPRKRGLTEEGGIAAYELPPKEKELAGMFRDVSPEDKFVYLSPTPLSENSVAVDISSFPERVRQTGQAEGYAIVRGDIPASAVKTKTQAAPEPTAPKELPLTQAVKGTLTPEQRNLAETGNLKGLLQNLLDQAQGTFNLGSVLSPARREVASILRRMLSVNTGTKLVVGTPTGKMALREPFVESKYRPSVINWAKKEFGGRIAPNGNPVWENFVRWFGDSQVVNEKGAPLVMYHGTFQDFEVFNRLWTLGIRQRSIDTVGNWFSDNPGKGGAESYGSTIMPAFLKAKKLKSYNNFDDFLREMHEAEGRDFSKQTPKGIGSAEGLRAKLKAQGYDGIIFPKSNWTQLKAEEKSILDAISQVEEEYRQEAKKLRDAGKEMTGRQGRPFKEKIDSLEQDLKKIREDLGRGLGQEWAEQTAVVVFEPEQIKSSVGNNGNFSETPSILSLPKAGSYDPTTDTITLDPNNGLNAHTLVHEASHALLSHTLDNPNHPVTKEVTNLYNQMKASSEGAYGATDVQEFAAEAWGNPEFRDHLRQFKPTGQKLDGWKRLINALRRLFGFGSNYETAYDKLDNLLSQIISPAPESRAGETLYAQSLDTPNFGAAVGRQLDNTLSKIGALDPKKVAQVWAMLEKLSNPLRSLFYKSLNLYGLGNVGTRYFGDKSMKFSDLFNEMYGAETQLLERMKPLHDRLTEHRHKNPELHAELSKLATDATKEDVRPYDEAKSMYDGTPKAITWKKLNDRFNDLKRRSPETTQLYRDVFATFKALQEEFKKSLRQGIEATAKDSATALSAYQKIMQELASMEIDHYIPLYREGSYWLTYAVNGIPTTRLFKTDAERKAARAQAEANGAVDIEEFSRADQFRERNVPDNTMLASIMKIMKDSGAQKEDLDKLIHLVVSTFPETSILKSRQHRKGVAGYMDDNLALVFDKVTSRSARQIARLRYRKKLRDVLDEMYGDQAKLRGDASTDAKNMLEEFEGRYEFGMNPNLSLFSQFASSGAFFFNLAANVSSAVVQTMQVPMIVYPMLGGKYGFIDSWKALQNAYGLYSTSGLTRVVKGLDGRETTEKSMLSVENRVNRGDKEVSKYSGLIEALKNHGLLYSSTARDALSSENANDSGYGGVNKLWRVTTQVSSFMQHHSERMNREVTALAAYDLEMERLKNNKKMSEAEKEAKAIQEAIRMVEYTHGAGSTMTGPSLGQSDIGKVLMVFKRFGVSMYYMLFDTMFRALPVRANATQEEKDATKAARAQLVGIYGMAAIFAGAKGIPMYWMAELAYNMLRDKDDDDFDAVMRRFLGDFLYKGPVNYFTNLSIADRVGWADLIWRENKGSRADASAVSQFLEGALGAPYSMFKNVESGFKQVADGHFYRGIETMLPATLKNVMKGGRYALEGANTLRGDPVMGNINGYNAAMQVLGFAPADLMKQYEENAYILGKQDAILGEQNRLMKQYYTAIHQNDFDRAFTLREKLFELGMKYPELQINDTTLNKKVKARDRISEKMYHGVTLNDKLRARLEGAAQITYGGSFDGGGASGRF